MATTKSVSTQAKRIKGARVAHSAATSAMLVRSGSAMSNDDAFAIKLPSSVLKTLSARQPTIKRLMETLGQTIARNQKNGRASGFTVMIDAEGNPEVSALPDPVAAQPVAEEDRLDDALRAARERGRLRAAEILDQADMLTAEAFAERLGVSRVTVNARRQKHELLGLDGAKRGFRFPAWQVDEDGKPLGMLPQLFELLGDSPWGVYRFLTQRHAVLNGATAREALGRGKTEQVLQAAESLARGDFS
ncbi:hypothetical protein [Novosphingobium sp. NBM11]|uniref:hypothetical protein n=1 Tax=Novosphingobium sp. NBM11 TaxID=2596914 RepID=UPI0019D6101A|nr:hypothetical protein [Novosphingobium sp. NBM11]